jgi:ketosteroid isomerase-like protein
MHKTERRSFLQPDETRNFPHGRAEIVKIGESDVGRLVFEPQWRWSNDVKPLAGTESCEAPHFQYHVSGLLAIRMDDGEEFIAEPGDVTSLPRGHDAWVVGDEPVVVVDWYGASTYAKAATEHTRNATAVVEQFGAAWVAHELDTALSMLADDCVFDSTGPSPDGTRYVGREEIRTAWKPIFDDDSSRFEVEQTIDMGDSVVSLWRYSWTNGHVRGIDVFRVRDGLISEKLSYVKG